MAGKVTWTLTSGDVEVLVTATETDDQNVEFSYELVSGTADLNGFYIDIDDDGGDISKIGGGNGMKGSNADGDKLNGFDFAEEIGTVGGNDEDTTSGTLTYSMEELGIESLEDLADAEIGIRATSVGEDREGSLKLSDTGEYCPPDEEPPDDFPEWGQDISNLTLIFDQEEGDDNGDGYYTIKFDVPEDLGEDPDAYMAEILALMGDEGLINPDDETLMGVVIKGGQQETAYFAYGDYNQNGTEADELPEGIGFELTGDHHNVDPVSEIDDSGTLEFSDSGTLFMMLPDTSSNNDALIKIDTDLNPDLDEWGDLYTPV